MFKFLVFFRYTDLHHLVVGMSTAQIPTAVSHLELAVCLTAVEMFSARTLRDVAQLVPPLSVVHCSQLTRKLKMLQMFSARTLRDVAQLGPPLSVVHCS